MKIVFLLTAFVASAFAATPPTPRVLTTPAASFPKAEVQRLDPAAGVLVFRWLNAQGTPVDSGGSIARFAPAAPLPADPQNPNAPATYPAVSDATLVAAITSPAAEPPAVGVWTTLTFVERFTDPEKVAIFTSVDPQVIVARSLGLAAQEIRTDDPRTQALMTLLVAKGLVTESRKTAILTP